MSSMFHRVTLAIAMGLAIRAQANICTWYNVGCSGSSTVVLGNWSMPSGHIDATWFSGSNMTPGQYTSLLLNNLQITGIAADTFRAMTNLLELDLSDNLLSQIQPGTFDNLSKLQRLNLQRNKVTLMPSGILDALISLSYIGLEYNPDLGALPRTLFSKQAHYTGNWPFPLTLRLRIGMPSLKCVPLPPPNMSLSNYWNDGLQTCPDDGTTGGSSSGAVTHRSRSNVVVTVVVTIISAVLLL